MFYIDNLQRDSGIYLATANEIPGCCRESMSSRGSNPYTGSDFEMGDDFQNWFERRLKLTRKYSESETEEQASNVNGSDENLLSIDTVVSVLPMKKKPESNHASKENLCENPDVNTFKYQVEDTEIDDGSQVPGIPQGGVPASKVLETGPTLRRTLHVPMQNRRNYVLESGEYDDGDDEADEDDDEDGCDDSNEKEPSMEETKTHENSLQDSPENDTNNDDKIIPDSHKSETAACISPHVKLRSGRVSQDTNKGDPPPVPQRISRRSTLNKPAVQEPSQIFRNTLNMFEKASSPPQSDAPKFNFRSKKESEGDTVTTSATEEDASVLKPSAPQTRKRIASPPNDCVLIEPTFVVNDCESKSTKHGRKRSFADYNNVVPAHKPSSAEKSKAMQGYRNHRIDKTMK
jgi:hypothetical protein